MIYKSEEYIAEDAESQKFPVKQIECLTAIDGSSTKYIGRLAMAVQTPMGVTQMPISFDISAESVEDAFQKFETFAVGAIERAKRELQQRVDEIRRKAESRIVTPDQLSTTGITKLQGMGGQGIKLP